MIVLLAVVFRLGLRRRLLDAALEQAERGRYYGLRMALFLGATFYVSAALAGFVVEILFGAVGAIPYRSTAHRPTDGIAWNYTTWVNIVFLVLATALVIRFLRTGGGCRSCA